MNANIALQYVIKFNHKNANKVQAHQNFIFPSVVFY